MDYTKVRKWLRFYEREGVSAEEAVALIVFYVRNLTDISYLGFDDEEYKGPLLSRKAEKEDDDK